MNTERYGVTVDMSGLVMMPFVVRCALCKKEVRHGRDFDQAQARAEDHLLLYHLELVGLKDLQ